MMICLCNKYPYQNTLEYKTNNRVGFQNNNFKMRHDESLVLEYLNDEEQYNNNKISNYYNFTLHM